MATYLEALRPKQWIKNGLVFLPLLFAIDLVWAPDNLGPLPGLLLNLLGLFAAFCLTASGIYLFNDLMDREADRQHPTKKERPIASGRVPAVVAAILALALAVGGLAFMFWLGWALGGIGVVYVSANLGYSLGLKNVILVDVFLVAAGYVLRAGAGAVAVGVAPSPWLYVVTAAGALFLVLGRRYAETRLAGQDSARQRPVLAGYSGPFINQLLIVSAAAALVSYTLYAVEVGGLRSSHYMLATVPFVAFGLFRYLYLLNASERAESPEQLVTGDPLFVLAALGWLITVAAALLLS